MNLAIDTAGLTKWTDLEVAEDGTVSIPEGLPVRLGFQDGPEIVRFLQPVSAPADIVAEALSRRGLHLPGHHPEEEHPEGHSEEEHSDGDAPADEGHSKKGSE